jgi:hypothetical protein
MVGILIFRFVQPDPGSGRMAQRFAKQQIKVARHALSRRRPGHFSAPRPTLGCSCGQVRMPGAGAQIPWCARRWAKRLQL